MQLLRTLIVDDEPYAHELMEKYVSATPGLELAGHCWDAIETFRMLHTNHIDLILLDIKMPDISGIDFLKKLKDPPKIILTTAFSEYALESYELNVVDYLLKPFSYDRFVKAINRVVEMSHGSKPITFETSAPTVNTQNTGVEDFLFVRSEGKLVKIELNKLVYIESLKDYLQLFVGKERVIIHGTMKNMEDQLKGLHSFLRINKSYIINIQYINEVDGSVIKLGSASVPIGKTYRDKVYSYLNKFKLM